VESPTTYGNVPVSANGEPRNYRHWWNGVEGAAGNYDCAESGVCDGPGILDASDSASVGKFSRRVQRAKLLSEHLDANAAEWEKDLQIGFVNCVGLARPRRKHSNTGRVD
jgi:hypothetical protein